MITLPKMELKKIDPAKVFNSLNVIDTTNAKLATNYYLLTPDQRAFVDELINICESEFQNQIEIYNEDLENEDLEYVEQDLNDQ